MQQSLTDTQTPADGTAEPSTAVAPAGCGFTLWVDADACPRVLRELILRASDRHQLPVVFVANQGQDIPVSRWVKRLQVMHGADVADQAIVDRMQAGDLVMTQDVPLAAQVVDKGGIVLQPRGDILDQGNAQMRLQLRNFAEGLRESGQLRGGPPPLGDRDRKAFADSLEKLIVRRKRQLAIRP